MDAILKAIEKQIDGEISTIDCEAIYNGVLHTITGTVHCSFLEYSGGRDEYGNTEQLSRCIDVTPYLEISFQDESDNTVYIDVLNIEIELIKRLIQ